MKYIKADEVEQMVYSIIKNWHHLKKAMKDMTFDEENEFMTNIMNGNFNIIEL